MPQRLILGRGNEKSCYRYILVGKGLKRVILAIVNISLVLGTYLGLVYFMLIVKEELVFKDKFMLIVKEELVFKDKFMQFI